MQNLIENEFDFDCAQQHRLPICAILQDSNLNVKDRLLCQQCILYLDSEKPILVLRKVQDKIQYHMKEKQQINQQLISPLLPLVKQVKSNAEFLKESIMKEFRILEETIEEWQIELSKEIKLLENIQFINEMEYVPLDEVLKKDLNQLNSIKISKVQSKLNFFNQFEQYKICSILNSIQEEKFSLQINQSIDKQSYELDNQKNIFSDSAQISNLNSDTTQQSQIFQQEQSPQSKQINQDNLSNKQQLYQQKNVEQIQLKEGLSLPLIKLVTTKDGYPQYQYYGQQFNNSIQYKSIVFIGQRDEGKTTLLNAFVNYYFGIAWDDKFRIIVADQEKTTEISHYYIEPFNQRSYGIHLIDTPGNYGQDDKYTINKVSQLLRDNQFTVDIMIVCIKATNTRLTVELCQMETVNQQNCCCSYFFFRRGCGFLSPHLDSDNHLEFNSQSIIKLTNNKSAKVYYETSIENLKKIESKKLIDFSTLNQQINSNQYYQLPNNMVPNYQDSSQKQLSQDQQTQKGYLDRLYQQVYLDSYNQLKTLFKQLLKINMKSNKTQLQRSEKSVQYYSLNCVQCQITCFCGFKDEKVADDFYNKELNGKSCCGHQKPTIITQIKQQDNKNTYIKHSVYSAFYINYFNQKKKNESKNQYQFLEILKKEEEQDQKILENFYQELCQSQQGNKQMVTNNSNQIQGNQQFKNSAQYQQQYSALQNNPTNNKK